MGYKAAASDRRAFPRIPAALPVQIVRPDSFCDEPIAATLEDISQSGALVFSPVPIPVGEWIVIRPDQKGAGFGAEITAVVEHDLSKAPGQAKLACRFPQPVDYSVFRLFM